MRVRQLKVNPKTSQDTLSKMRAIHNESVQLFEERRDIGGFLNQVKQKLKEKNSTIYKLQGELNLNKKTIYRWFDKSKQPSQALQKLVCEHLDIPYYTLALTPNEHGEFPCGLKICSKCQNEFAIFKKSNYCCHRCFDFKQKALPL